MPNKATKQYFQLYAEPEVALANDLIHQLSDDCYQSAICIPFYDEQLTFLNSLNAACEYTQCKQLLLLNINQPENSDYCENNHFAFQQLIKGTALWQQDTLRLINFSPCLDILIVDRFSTALIPLKQGVGLARKIITDIAAKLIIQQCISNHFIYSSDADVEFPLNYLSIISNFDIKSNTKPEHSAIVFDFSHRDSTVNHLSDSNKTSINTATQYYEASLHAYVEGLRTAGSPYAFHTIGSCLAIDCSCYIFARGFPKRAGGEDFYLLNKLNKLAPVKSVKKPCLHIASRCSHRVPFGTGPAVEKILDGYDKLFYPAPCFELLKQWLVVLDTLANFNQVEALINYIEQLDLNKDLQRLFEQLKTQQQALAFLKQHKPLVQRKKAYHDWFDGFKTLKAIHLFAETYPKCNLSDFKTSLR